MTTSTPQDRTPQKLVLQLREDRPTKNMVIYAADDGKESIVPVYISQAKLIEAFGRIPLSIRITVEATDV